MQEKVSIITPVYNAEKFLKDSIDSVLTQTYSNWELLLIDDCSTDNSSEIIKSYSDKDERIKALSTPVNSGPAKARNIGIKEASGRYIAFLDSDDMWKKNKLEKQVEFMQENNCSFVYSNYDFINHLGEHIKVFNASTKARYKDLIKSNYIGCLTAMYDSSKIGKRYFFDYNKGAEDFILWLSILKEGITACNVNENLAFYRIVEDSRSRDKGKVAKEQWYVYRKIEKLNIIKSAWCFFNYAYKGFIKNK